MNRVSDGDRSTLLSFVSSQGYAPQSDEVISILRVLFRYVGIGTRLALTSMSWLTTRSPSRQGKTRAVHTVILASPVTFVLQDTPPSVTDCAGDGVLTNGNHMVVSCVCASRLNLLPQDDLPKFLLLLPQAVRDEASLVSSVQTRHVSWSSRPGGRHEDRQE